MHLLILANFLDNLNNFHGRIHVIYLKWRNSGANKVWRKIQNLRAKVTKYAPKLSKYLKIRGQARG